MEIIIICLAVVVVIAMVILSIILYNFMLLTSEMNKRLVYIVSDVLGNITMSTPHLDTLFKNETVNEEEILDTEGEEPFNPHNYDPLKIDEES